MKISIVKLQKNAVVPSYQSEQAAGVDLHACLDESILLKAGDFIVIPTGLAVAIPKGYEGQVRSRSGLAAKHGVAVLNSPGTIDSDYRGELSVILINHSNNDFIINHSDRIAQFVIAKHEQVDFVESDELNTTVRGTGGLGSTGR
ncbi:MAG: dUTP diphosphatase [bacterium]|nr:dUTP diphosphatase [bacterium]